MFEFRPLDSLDQIELEMMVESLQKSAEKQTSGSSKLTLVAAAAAVGGVAYLASPHGRKKVRSIRTKLAQWISPEKPMPMWVEEQPQTTKKESKKTPTPVVKTEI